MREGRLKIGIFGAGSVGCFIGGMLADSGCSVIMVGRAKMERKLEQGLVLTRYDGLRRDVARDGFGFSADPGTLGDCDCVLVCVKSADTAQAGQSLANVFAEAKDKPPIFSFQNGVSNAETLRELLPGTEVGAGMVGFNVARIGDNRFHCGIEGGIAVEAVGEASKLVSFLNKAGVNGRAVADMQPVLWGKLLLNLNNAVNALSGLPLKKELSQRDYRAVFAASIRETLTVLKTANIRPAKVGKLPPALLPTVLETPDWLFKVLAAGMLKIDDSARSSMAEDLEYGRQPEVDWLNGETVRLGRRTNVATPVNARIVELVKQVFATPAKSGISGAELRRLVGI